MEISNASLSRTQHFPVTNDLSLSNMCIFYYCPYTMYSYSIKWILIIRTQYEGNIVLSVETKYDIFKNLEAAVGATELANVHNAGKITIANIKKQKHDTDVNYLKHVDPSSAGNEVPYVE